MNYKLIPPIENGYNFWDIIDNTKENSIAVITIWARVKNAEDLAMRICRELNEN